MNRRTEENKLKQALSFGQETVELVDAPDAGKRKRSSAKKREPADRTAALRIQQSGRDVARTTRPKRTSKAAPATSASDEFDFVKTTGVGIEDAPAENDITAAPFVSNAEVQAGEPGLPQSVETSRIAAEHPGFGSGSANQEMDCESEVRFSGSSFLAKEGDAQGKQTEITTTLETLQSTKSQWEIILRWMTSAWQWSRKRLGSRQARKRLRVCESVSLGEKRFVAVIEVDGEQFLVGGASSSVTTLARLEPPKGFAAVLKRRWAQEPIQA